MIRRLGACLGGALVATACVAAAPAQNPRGEPAKSEPLAVRPVALMNAGFENAQRPGERCPEHWGCTMHSNPDSFRFALDRASPGEGAQSLCIERVHDEPWALATQSLEAAALRGARLRFSIAVRIDRAEGAGAGPFIIVHGPTGNLAHEERLVKRTDAWQRIGVEFSVPPTAQGIEVGATLQGGGRVCIDDARLEFSQATKP